MPRRAKPARSGAVRIIGGRLRGRILRFEAAPGLRPTPDRLRETLFNWLAPDIAGARCLDLFAGSGALGFEAVSRGAVAATLVDNHGPTSACLRRNAERLAPDAVTVVRQSAWTFLRSGAERYDVIFIDPPFDALIGRRALDAVRASNRLDDGGLVYLERRAADRETVPGTQWTRLRESTSGDARGCLLRPVKTASALDTRPETG